MSYVDRQDAGKRLAQTLRYLQGKDVVVFALPRGGVVLGAEVAKVLHAPLGLVLVRKIGHPSAPEYAIGAVVLGHKPVWNEDETAMLDKAWMKQTVEAAQASNKQRQALYFEDDYVPPGLKGKTVVIVDDGIATGLTMKAAVHAVLEQHPKRVVVAVPVASAESADMLESIADEVVVLDNPENFPGSVGAHYRYFDQVDDDEVRMLLKEVNDDLQSTLTENRQTTAA